MDSRIFKEHISKYWRGKQGVYVIENDLFSKHLGKRIFKIGYSRYDMSGRVQDYVTAYSPFIPFKIHLLYEVPEKVRGQRPNFALLTEARIHNTLKKMNKWGEAEWFYDLDAIMNVISSVRLEHLDKIPDAKKWTFYSTHISNMTVKVDSEANVSSRLKDLRVMTQEEKDRRQRQASKNLDLRDRVRVTHREPKKLNIPTTYVDIDGTTKKI